MIVKELSSSYFMPSSKGISGNCIREADSKMVSMRLLSSAVWLGQIFPQQEWTEDLVWTPSVQGNLIAATFLGSLLNLLQTKSNYLWSL